MNGPTRPILRYHGGKWMLAPWIVSHFPRHRIYNEGCGGAASVLLRKPRVEAEVYNDVDGEVVNLFRVVQSKRRRLMRALMRTPFAREEYVLSCEPCEDPVERARRTVIRSFFGFGTNALRGRSGFRATGWQCRSQTPVQDWINYPASLRDLEKRFTGVLIENKPATFVIQQQDSADTLHYLDPPYVHSTRTLVERFGDKGYAHEMTDDDHRELAVVLRGVSGMVVLSGYHSPLYDELYEGWETVTRDTYGDGACERTEVLWLNPAADAALHHGSLFKAGGAA